MGGSCNANFADCDKNPLNGCEVEVDNDPLNCGGCGKACGVGTCVGGICQKPEMIASQLPTVVNVVVDSKNAYFTSGGHAPTYMDGGVYSVPLAGGAPPTTLFATAPSCEALALDNDFLLFGSDGTQYDWTDGFIARMPKSGGPPDIFAKGQPYAQVVIVKGANYYWTSAGTLANKFLDGAVRTSVGTMSITPISDPETAPVSIYADDTHVYWTDQGTQANNLKDGALRRKPIAGGPIETLAANLHSPSMVIGIGNLIYFGARGELDCVDPAEPGVVHTVVNQVKNISRLAVDGPYIYWTEANSPGRVARMAIAGGPVIAIADGLNNPYGLTTDATHIYFTERGVGKDDGTILRIAK
jgi:hypothetical protein